MISEFLCMRNDYLGRTDAILSVNKGIKVSYCCIIFAI